MNINRPNEHGIKKNYINVKKLHEQKEKLHEHNKSNMNVKNTT